MMGSMYALGCMNAVCTIPLVVKVLFGKRLDNKKDPDIKHKLVSVVLKLMDIGALILQVGAVVVSIYMFNKTYGETYFRSMESLGRECPPANKTDVDVLSLYWQIPLAMVLVSVKWWENFIDTRNDNRMRQLKNSIAMGRAKLNLLLSAVGIITIVGWAYLVDWIMGEALENFPGVLVPDAQGIEDFDYGSNYAQLIVDRYVTTIAPALVQIASCLVCYYCGSLACKLLMQRFSFALPLYLATPLTGLVIYLQCQGHIAQFPTGAGLRFEYVCYCWEDSYWFLLCGAVWWLTMLWTAAHVWFPKSEVLAVTEK